MTRHTNTTSPHNNQTSNQKAKRVQAKYVELMNPYAAGIDIGSRSHFVAAPIITKDSHEICIREFSSFTPDLWLLAKWLKECNVTSVVMESTGVYWIPLYEILESQGFEVSLVDARHVKNVTGRKTDIEDCQWLQQLHASGLLSGAFRPNDKILPLRSYMRQRENLIKASSTSVQHMQKALTQMNLHLCNVITNIVGLTGMQIIRAIISGVHDPKILAKFRDPRCKQSQDIIEKSVTGNYRAEHLFSLKQAVETFDFIQAQVLNCDKQIEEALIALSPSSSSSNIDSHSDTNIQNQNSKEEKIAKSQLPRSYKSRSGNKFYFDPSSMLQEITKVDLTKIPGIEVNAAVKILSEVGADLSKWKSAKHFTSWLALSPENKVSGGKQLSSRTKTSKNRAAEIFRLAAFSLHRSPTALGGFLRRIKSKHGAPKAITATARKIVTIFYSMLTQGTEYVEAGLYYYEEQYKERLIKGLQKRAQALGMALIPALNNEEAFGITAG